MNALLRALRPDERRDVLSLWEEVFGDTNGDYFRHYFEADPEFREEECLVAEVEGRLVSAVLICRRRMEWEGRELLCGAIANVATRVEYRRRGLSRALLQRAIERMEAGRFDFSMLLTGSPGHYRPLGWEPVTVPRWRVRLTRKPPAPALPIDVTSPVPIPPAVRAVYDAPPRRPLHLYRPPLYWDGWVSRYWRGRKDSELLLAGALEALIGYALLSHHPFQRRTSVHELRARDADAEVSLLCAAADRALKHGAETLRLSFVPQFDLWEAVADLGAAERETEEGLMLRNISLPVEEWARIVALYACGTATLWWADDF